MITIRIRPGQVLLALSAESVVLAALSLAGQSAVFFCGLRDYLSVVDLFWVDAEANVPTWYSSLLLVAIALLAAMLAAGAPAGQDRARWEWGGLAAIFALLSLDEASGVHELLISPVRQALHAQGVLYYAWVVPGTVFVVVFALTFARLVFRLPVEVRRVLSAAAGVYLAGALGMEMVGGWYADRVSDSTFTFALLTTIEETLEMLGASLGVYGLFRQFASSGGEVVLRIER